MLVSEVIEEEGGRRTSVARAAPPQIHILVLEDDALDFELLAEMLASSTLSCRVTRASDRDTYLKAIAADPPQLILSDFSLPGYDGLAALEAAKQLCPEAPFIFVTGALGEELAIETLRRGAIDYVLKQHLDRLLPAAERALKEVEDRAERRRAEAERDQLLIREREARQEAETANRLKDEFLAMVSHELRTPLNAMLGWLRLLRTGALPEEKRTRALETVERNARVQAQLVEDLLEVSRIVTGKIKLEMAPVDLGGVVSAVAESLWPVARAKGVQLSIDHEADLPAVTGDTERLQQVVWNLVSNGIKFTPAGGTVSIRITGGGGIGRIEVADTGEGIAPDFLPYVFDRFRQADEGRTRRHGGLGLGLAIVRHLIEMHGGTAHAHSAGVGHGATFSVTLPLAAAPQPARAYSANPAPPPAAEHPRPRDGELLRGVRVLVVDDEADARELLAVALEQWGASVRVTASAAEALTAVQEQTPDVIVSDVGMPGCDGYDFVRSVRQMTSERGITVRALAVTAYARYEDQVQALAAGFDRHVAKPVEPAALAAAIAQLIGLRDTSGP